MAVVLAGVVERAGEVERQMEGGGGVGTACEKGEADVTAEVVPEEAVGYVCGTDPLHWVVVVVVVS